MQFASGERVGEPRTVPRPVDVTRGRLPGQYHLLASRVTRLLAAGAPDTAGWPVPVKAVCLDPEGRALLCRNHRGQWELPGGRPASGELFADTVARETREETGLVVRAGRLLGVEPLEPVPGQWVDVVAYDCPPDGHLRRAPKASAEHTAVAFLDVVELDDAELPALYKRFITATLST